LSKLKATLSLSLSLNGDLIIVSSPEAYRKNPRDKEKHKPKIVNRSIDRRQKSSPKHEEKGDPSFPLTALSLSLSSL
jgi:hypothetical protein